MATADTSGPIVRRIGALFVTRTRQLGTRRRMDLSKIKKVKYVDLYSGEAPLMRYTASRKSALISASQSDSQTFSEHCETTDTG